MPVDADDDLGIRDSDIWKIPQAACLALLITTALHGDQPLLQYPDVTPMLKDFIELNYTMPSSAGQNPSSLLVYRLKGYAVLLHSIMTENLGSLTACHCPQQLLDAVIEAAGDKTKTALLPLENGAFQRWVLGSTLSEAFGATVMRVRISQTIPRNITTREDYATAVNMVCFDNPLGN